MRIDETGAGGTNALTERYEVEITPKLEGRVWVRVRRSWDGHALTGFSPASLTSDMIGVLIEDHRERADIDMPEPKTLDLAVQVTGLSIIQLWKVEELDHRPPAPADPGTIRPCIPFSALGLLGEILREAKRGKIVTVIPMHAELTVEEAASFLKVSAAHVTQLREESRLPSRQAKPGRIILFRDLVDFQRQAKAEAATEAAAHTATDQAAEPRDDLGPPSEQLDRSSGGST